MPQGFGGKFLTRSILEKTTVTNMRNFVSIQHGHIVKRAVVAAWLPVPWRAEGQELEEGRMALTYVQTSS